METNIINATFRTKETIIAEVKATIEHVETTAMIGAIKIGKCYVELKELIPHGGWYKYIEENTGHSPKKVERFMKIYTEYGDENTPLGSLFSKTTLMSELSITKALSLIALPDEEVENFVAENNIGDMTVKELEEKIKVIQAEKEKAEKEARDIKEQLRKAVAENDGYAERENELVDQINELQEKQKGAGQADLQQEIEKAVATVQADLEKLKKQKEQSDREIKQLQREAEAQEKAMKERIADEVAQAEEQAREKERAKLKEELDRIKRQAEEAAKKEAEAERKLQAANNATLMKFKFLVDRIQIYYKEAVDTIGEAELENEDEATRFRTALTRVLEKMQEGLR